MYNRVMSDNTIKFVFNQTAHYGGVRYQSGDVVELSVEDADKFKSVGFGDVYKQKSVKKKKEKK
jgi:hypothetical protein